MTINRSSIGQQISKPGFKTKRKKSLKKGKVLNKKQKRNRLY